MGKREEQPDERYKTALCIHFTKRGYCSFGDGCHFAHGVEELNPRPAYRRLGRLGEAAAAAAAQGALTQEGSRSYEALSPREPPAAYQPYDLPGPAFDEGPPHRLSAQMAGGSTHGTAGGRGGGGGRGSGMMQQQGVGRGRGRGYGPGHGPRSPSGTIGSSAGVRDFAAIPSGGPQAQHLSEAALCLMKEHKKRTCVNSLLEMGFDAQLAQHAAGATGCDAGKAVLMLTERSLVAGWKGTVMAAKPIDITGEAQQLLKAARSLGFLAQDVELEVVMAQGNWEAAAEALEIRAASAASQASAPPAAYSRPPLAAFPAAAAAAQSPAPARPASPPKFTGVPELDAGSWAEPAGFGSSGGSATWQAAGHGMHSVPQSQASINSYGGGSGQGFQQSARRPVPPPPLSSARRRAAAAVGPAATAAAAATGAAGAKQSPAALSAKVAPAAAAAGATVVPAGGTSELQNGHGQDSQAVDEEELQRMLSMLCAT